MNPQEFINYVTHFSYLGIFLFSFLAGYLIPVPEEAVLLLVGYASAAGLGNVYLAAAIGVGGILSGDNLLFWLSRRGDKYIAKLRQKFQSSKLLRYELLMKEHIIKSIFVLRFMVGLRFLGPILAGSKKMRWLLFLGYDFLATTCYVSILVFLGYYFHNRIAAVIIDLEIARHVISVLLFAVLGWFISRYIQRKFLVKEGEKDSSTVLF